MHILYVNAHLAQGNTEQSTSGRRFVAELRAAGLTVSTVPAIDEEAGTGRVAQSRFSWLKRRLPTRLYLALVEPIQMLRGIRSTLHLGLQARRLNIVPDVIYGRVMNYDWAPWLISRWLERPVVLEVHVLQYLDRTFWGRRRSRILRKLEQVQWRAAAQLRVLSRPIVRLLESEGIDSERIHWVPHAIELSDRARRDKPENELNIVFVGTFVPYHGVEVLLRAFAGARSEIPGAHLELIGDGVTRRDNELLAQELGVAEAVDFTGWLSREEALARVCASDIATAPFLEIEPFWYDPIKIVEYMSAGVAIIASRLDRIAEMLHDGRGGVLVPPGDAGALAGELVRLSRNAAERARLGAAAQDILIEEGHSPEKVTQSVVALCTEALAD